MYIQSSHRSNLTGGGHYYYILLYIIIYYYILLSYYILFYITIVTSILKPRWSNSDHDRVVSVCSFGLRALTHDRAIFLNNLSIRSPIPPHALPHIAGRNGTLSWRFVMAFCHGDLSWRFVTAICRGNPVSVGSSGNLFII